MSFYVSKYKQQIMWLGFQWDSQTGTAEVFIIRLSYAIIIFAMFFLGLT